MIDFEDVRRSYGKKIAVDGLTLSIPSGELFAFLGPNGAGKTTSIKMLVGLLRADSGRIRVCGVDVAAETRQAVSRIGYVPDEPYVYDKLTGREFLRFVSEMYGFDVEDGNRRIEREIDRFELEDFVDRLSESYSHGMKQRLVFASALLHDPEVLVIDEPMVGLDPRSARLVKDLLREKARTGTTIFMSTHSLAVAEEIADRIGIIHRGKLVSAGTLDSLREEQAKGESTLEQMFLTITDGDASGLDGDAHAGHDHMGSKSHVGDAN